MGMGIEYDRIRREGRGGDENTRWARRGKRDGVCNQAQE